MLFENDRMKNGIFQPRFDLVDFSSQDDDESVHDTISTAAQC